MPLDYVIRPFSFRNVGFGIKIPASYICFGFGFCRIPIIAQAADGLSPRFAYAPGVLVQLSVLLF